MTRGRPRRAAGTRIHLIAVAAFALLFALWRISAGDPLTDALEERLLDLRFQLRGPVAAPDTVVVVAIDERTVAELGWSPPPRWAIAEGLERIIAAGPRVIALDLLFLDQTAAGPGLAAALARFDRAVVAAAVTNISEGVADGPPSELGAALNRSVIPVVADPPAEDPSAGTPRLLLPRAEFVGGAGLGHVNIVRSGDRVARRVPLAVWIGGAGFLPAMSLEAARRMRGLERGDIVLWPGRAVTFGERRITTDRTGSVTVNHYGGRGWLPTVSLIDLIEGRVPPSAFAGRAVFVGATAESLSDLFATPYAADVPGAEIIATLTANLIDGRLIERGAPALALDLALAVLLACFGYLAGTRRAPWACAAGFGAMWLTGAAALHLAFAEAQLWLDATAILGALAFATVWMTVVRLRAERQMTDAMTRERGHLARYVPPVLADDLARGAVPDFDRRTQDAAVLFVDVVGYTTLSETLTPDGTAAFLRDLHRLYERSATTHGGVIASFEGDGAMIVFGLPEPAVGDAAAALACGRMLLAEAGGFASAACPGHRLRLRVSLHHGPVTAAVLGGERQAQVTVTGDTVNVASRLQEIAKRHGSPLAVSRAALDAAGITGAAAGLVPLADQPVRGRAEPIEAWALPARGG